MLVTVNKQVGSFVTVQQITKIETFIDTGFDFIALLMNLVTSLI